MGEASSYLHLERAGGGLAPSSAIDPLRMATRQVATFFKTVGLDLHLQAQQQERGVVMAIPVLMLMMVMKHCCIGQAYVPVPAGMQKKSELTPGVSLGHPEGMRCAA